MDTTTAQDKILHEDAPILERLKRGVRRFQRDTYPKHAELYRKLASRPQQPHSLVITCADSRIDIETIMDAAPGELFVLRNVGNLVPAYGEMMGGVSAVIEYAVGVLEVEHVVVCGHSDCGAMKALLDPSLVAEAPTVATWLRNAWAARGISEALSTPGESRHDALVRMTEESVRLQLHHLKTHPSVAAAMARGRLTLSGWIYDIGPGHVRICSEGERHFELFSEEDR